MDIRIQPHPLEGAIEAIPSKSMAHRLLILSALAEGITDIALPQGSQDIDATLRCITALGAVPGKTVRGLSIVPLTMRGTRTNARLDVGESGSTLRFLLPVVAALGCSASFEGHGRLAERPLSPLDEQLRTHGISLSPSGSFPLKLSGSLIPGTFRIPGNVSSQYVSGLLMAAPLLADDVAIDVKEPVESKPYIDLTIDALSSFGVRVKEGRAARGSATYHTYLIAADQQIVSPGTCRVEGDWSNAAFWLAAGALQKTPLSVTGLDPFSRQGDRAIMAALSMLGVRVGRGRGIIAASRDQLHAHTIDLSSIPDLAAPLAAVAACCTGTTRLTGASRLRLKESDRLETIRSTLTALGGRAAIEEDSLVIEGVPQLAGGTVDAAGDHRIAMMAAVCATHASGPTTIRGAECVAKSYPSFFEDYRSLGGIATEEEA